MHATRIFILFFALVFLSTTAFGFSILEFLGFKESEQNEEHQEVTNTAAAKENIKQPEKEGKTGNEALTSQETLDFIAVNDVMSLLNSEQKEKILADKETFTKFIQQEATNKSVLAAALANDVHKDKKTTIILQRNGENLLREIYLEKLIASKIPPEFPTEAQIEEYYTQNQDKFVLGERIHVWQIFLAFKENESDTKSVELLKKKAESIKKEIEKDKVDFAVAAKRHSDHEGSFTTGGYMGLVAVENLKPEIKQHVLDLKEGRISQPILSDEGIHLLKRGASVPEQNVSLDQVHDQIKKLLRQQLNVQLRQAIFEQARKTYPVDIDEKTIEKWRLQFKHDLTLTEN